MVVLALGCCAALSGMGCSEHTKRTWKPRSAEENFQAALEAASGDERRDAITRIAESGYATRDDAFAVFDTVARTDSVSQVRCVAVRALGQYSDARPVPTFLAVLGTQGPTPSQGALPADAHVRLETARSLLAFKKQGLLSAEEDAKALDAFLRLVDDPDRGVRLIAIQALGEYRDTRVFAPLIKMLRVKDFAVADRAERSLIQLTGTTHNYDPQAWEQWLTATPDPFAHAGEQPPMTRPSGPTWWDQQIRAWRRGLKLGRQE